MTSQSRSHTERVVLQQLELANQQLPEKVKADIAAARRNAMTMAENNRDMSTVGLIRSLQARLSYRPLQMGTPIALAAAFTLYVSYGPTNVPELPAELLDEEIPTVNIALLQDLEFASWLAEQGEEVLL